MTDCLSTSTPQGADASFDPKVYLQQGAWRDVRLGLHRTEELLERLGRPQDGLRIVHVAGTNGKGSTCAFIAGILQAAGYKTGLFTSPYILRFNERVQVNREDISDEDLLIDALRVREAACSMDEQPTAFELITAVALVHFARVGCQAVVLEVGLGGRLDSTNVVSPVVSVITPIALDHTHVLGDTIAKIAEEKAGIIKPGVPVVCYAQHPDADAVIRRKAHEVGAAVIVARFGRIHAHTEGLHQVFSYDGITDVRLRLAGVYQPCNAVMAIETARVLRERGFAIDDAAIKRGLEETVWQGRFEVVAGEGSFGRSDEQGPVIIVDGGHNEQGAEALASSLRAYFPEGGVTFVMSVLRDKKYLAMIDEVLPLAAGFFTATPPDNERALSAQELAQALREQSAAAGTSLPVQACASIQDAVRAACAAAGPDGVVCCFGSLYSIHDIMEGVHACTGSGAGFARG